MKRYIRATTDLDDFRINDEKATFSNTQETTKNVVIPDGVTRIYNGAFAGDKNLKHVTIPSSVEFIGSDSFAQCTNLEEIVIQDGVEAIGMSAFAGCIKLKHVTIPDSVEEIGMMAFIGCTSLEEIAIPEKAFLGYSAFADCENLKRVTLPDNVKVGRGWKKDIEFYGFQNCPNLEDIVTIKTKKTRKSNSKKSAVIRNPEEFAKICDQKGWISDAWERAADFDPDGELDNPEDFGDAVCSTFDECIEEWIKDAGYSLPEGLDIREWIDATDIYQKIYDEVDSYYNE